jgi:hypothetical protein
MTSSEYVLTKATRSTAKIHKEKRAFSIVTSETKVQHSVHICQLDGTSVHEKVVKTSAFSFAKNLVWVTGSSCFDKLSKSGGRDIVVARVPGFGAPLRGRPEAALDLTESHLQRRDFGFDDPIVSCHHR